MKDRIIRICLGSVLDPIRNLDFNDPVQSISRKNLIRFGSDFGPVYRFISKLTIYYPREPRNKEKEILVLLNFPKKKLSSD